MTRPKHEYDKVLQLVSAGHNDCEIARLTGIHRRTVLDWRWGRGAKARRYPEGYSGDCEHDFSSLPAKSYSYLLGMYLGDGYIAGHARGVYQLRIYSDAQYVGIIDECCKAMEAMFPEKHPYVLPRESRCVTISMYSKHWPCLFPQHGNGRKHDRLIRLESWQESIVRDEPKALLRGLIHSDGCRGVANDRGVESVRYHFSNRSEDIKKIFCSALDRLAIPWTRPSEREIAIYRKAATARLDEFIGPKA